MAKLNVKAPSKRTHEGAKAYMINAELQLRRSVMACMLWEDQFYEDGKSIAERIQKTIPLVDPQKVADIAIEAREKMKLRHVPLLLVREMAQLTTHKFLVAKTLERIIQRPDELTEFLAIYWNDGRQKLSAQVKKGLAAAFPKFDEFRLAKYNREGRVKLRDVLFLSHAKPKDEDQAEVWKRLIDGKMPIPVTWETELSAGKDKKATWQMLLAEKKLGALALLRNLRNMQEANVDEEAIIQALHIIKVERVLPYRFISAARFAPNLEPHLETGLFKCLEGQEKINGKTVLLIDVSGSMDAQVSGRSEIMRLDAACGLAMLIREICERFEIYTFSDQIAQIPPRRGFALRDVIVNSQPHSGTHLGAAIQVLNNKLGAYDRLIVITDEQSHDSVPVPTGRGYVINVASFQNGVGYGKWLHIDGWSEAVIDYIRMFEAQ